MQSDCGLSAQCKCDFFELREFMQNPSTRLQNHKSSLLVHRAYRDCVFDILAFPTVLSSVFVYRKCLENLADPGQRYKQNQECRDRISRFFPACSLRMLQWMLLVYRSNVCTHCLHTCAGLSSENTCDSFPGPVSDCMQVP